MLITMAGLTKLQALRQELQEDAGENFPQGVMTELLVLYDVCKLLELSIFQAREVLGELAWKSVTNYINSPICNEVNWKRAQHCADISVHA
jgi:hypothetical protein